MATIPLNVSMDLDLNPVEMPNGCKTFGKNWIYNTVNQSITNESGFTLKFTLRDKERFLGVITIPKGYILFTKDETDGINYGDFTDHIYWYENDILVKDIQSKELNLCRKYTEIKLDAIKSPADQKYDHITGTKAARQITGEYTYNYLKELIICWSEGVDDESNETRFLNLSTATGAPGYLENIDNAIARLTLSQNIVIPTVTTEIVNSGDAMTGTYQFAIKYKMAANSYTDTFKVTPSVYLTGNAAEGVSPGTSINKAIELNFNNLDAKFEEFKLVIYYKKEAAIEIKETADIVIINGTATYTMGSISSFTDGNLEENETHHANYVKCEGITAFQGELIQGNVVSLGYMIGERSVDDVGKELADALQVILRKGTVPVSYYTTDVNKMISFQSGENYMLYLNLIDTKGMYINSYPIRHKRGIDTTALCPYTQNPKYHYIPFENADIEPATYNKLTEGSFHAEYRILKNGVYKHIDIKSVVFDDRDVATNYTMELYSKQFSGLDTDSNTSILELANMDYTPLKSQMSIGPKSSETVSIVVTGLDIKSIVSDATDKTVYFAVFTRNLKGSPAFILDYNDSDNPDPDYNKYIPFTIKTESESDIENPTITIPLKSGTCTTMLAIAVYNSGTNNENNSLTVSGTGRYAIATSSNPVVQNLLDIVLPSKQQLNEILGSFTNIIGSISFSIAERNGNNNRVVSQVLFQRDTNANDLLSEQWGFLMGGDEDADTAFRIHSLDMLYLKPSLSGVGFQVRYVGQKNVPSLIFAPAFSTAGKNNEGNCHNGYEQVRNSNNVQGDSCKGRKPEEYLAGYQCCVRNGGALWSNLCNLTPPVILLSLLKTDGSGNKYWEDGVHNFKLTDKELNDWEIGYVCRELGGECGSSNCGINNTGSIFGAEGNNWLPVFRSIIKKENYMRMIWMRGIKSNITERALLADPFNDNEDNVVKASEYNDCVYLWDKNGYIETSGDRIVHKVKSIEYIQSNSDASHNTMGEGHYRVDFDNYLDNEFNWKLNHGIADIVNLSKEFYVDETAQTLVLSSAIYSINNLPVQIPLKGDTFIGDFTIRVTYPSPRWNAQAGMLDPEWDKYIFRIIHSGTLESRFNLHARYRGATDGEKIWVGKSYKNYASNDVKDLAPFFKVRPNIDNFIKTDTGEGYSTALNWNGMNTEQPVKSVTENQVSKLINRIIRSDKINPESLVLGWQKYKIDNYYDVPLERGAIVNLQSDTSNLYIQQEFGLRVASVKDQLAQGADSAYVGSGDLFDRYPQEVIFDKNGYIGCRDKFMCGITPLGYIVLDSTKGKIFQVFGNEAKEITAQNIKHWAEKELSHDLFEPLFGQSYHFGYDAKNTRLLFTRNGSRGEDESLTIDWSPVYNWGCFHDYIPNYQFHTRDGWYMISENKLYKGNDPNTKCMFFDNDVKQTVLQIVQTSRELQQGFVKSVEGVTVDRVYNNVIWQSIVKIGNRYFYDETINHIMLHNDTQCTGIIKVNDNLEWFDTETGVGKASKWFFNKIEDAVIDDKKEFLYNFVEVIKDNCDLSFKEFWEISNFISSFIVISLLYDNLFYSSSKKMFVPKPEDGEIPESWQQAEFSLITLDTDVDYSNR